MANQLIEVRVPDLGDYHDVEIIDVAVRPGDAVAVDATLITLETEKATMDVPSTAAGVVRVEARPVTTLCIRCKEEQEKKEKSYG